MQVHKPLQGILIYPKKFEKRKKFYFPKFKLFNSSKIRLFVERRL